MKAHTNEEVKNKVATKRTIDSLLAKGRKAWRAYESLANYRELNHHYVLKDELFNSQRPSRAGLVGLVQEAIGDDLHARVDAKGEKYFWNEFKRTATETRLVYPKRNLRLAEYEVRFGVVEALVNLAMVYYPQAFDEKRQALWARAKGFSKELREDALSGKTASLVRVRQVRDALKTYARSLDRVYHEGGTTTTDKNEFRGGLFAVVGRGKNKYSHIQDVALKSGVRCYVPMKGTKPVLGLKYAFVDLPNEQTYQKFVKHHVANFISNGNTFPVPMSIKDRSRLYALDQNLSRFDLGLGDEITKGAEVTVIDGPLDQIRGEVTHLHPSKGTATILCSGLFNSKSVPYTVPISYLVVTETVKR